MILAELVLAIVVVSSLRDLSRCDAGYDAVNVRSSVDLASVIQAALVRARAFL